MAIEKGKLQLEKYTYQNFLKLWKIGKFKHHRLGQAFYNHFQLHKLANQSQLCGLYEKDGIDAIETINRVFKFN